MYEQRSVFVFSFFFPYIKDCLLLLIQFNGYFFFVYICAVSFGQFSFFIYFHTFFFPEGLYGIFRTAYGLLQLHKLYFAVFLKIVYYFGSFMLSLIPVIYAYIVYKIFGRSYIFYLYIVVRPVFYSSGHYGL